MTNDIDQLLTTWANAERMGDAESLDAILADDFVGIGPVGFTLDKDAWLVRFDQGLRYEQLDLAEVTTRRHGETAIVVARQRAVGTHAGTPTPPDTRVSFTIVNAGSGAPRIGGMQYSFIGPPIGAGR